MSVYKALLAFQSEAPTLQKDAKNDHFKNRYVSLDSLTQTITPLLCKHGLVWTTQPTIADGEPALGYQLAHAESGEKIEGVMPLLLPKEDAQGYGSALTYARRYAASAVLGLSAEDDDGQAASRPKPGHAPKRAGGNVTADDIKALKAAGEGLTLEQKAGAFASVGLTLPDPPSWSGVPKAKARRLAEALAGIHR